MDYPRLLVLCGKIHEAFEYFKPVYTVVNADDHKTLDMAVRGYGQYLVRGYKNHTEYSELKNRGAYFMLILNEGDRPPLDAVFNAIIYDTGNVIGAIRALLTPPLPTYAEL
jgi:hypothetical protein